MTRDCNKITLARVPSKSAQSAQYEESLLPDEGIPSHTHHPIPGQHLSKASIIEG